MRSTFGAAAALVIAFGLAACTGASQPSAGSSSESFSAAASGSEPATPSMEVSPMTAAPSNRGSTGGSPAATGGPFRLTSSAFADGGRIPR